jgi:hypothetical protein
MYISALDSTELMHTSHALFHTHPLGWCAVSFEEVVEIELTGEPLCDKHIIDEPELVAFDPSR